MTVSFVSLRLLGVSLISASTMLLFAPGCSSSEDDSPKYPTNDAFCAAVADAECQVASKCAAKTDSCVSARKSKCATATNSTRVYQAKAAEACVDKFKEVYGTKSTITPDDIKTITDACKPVFTGTQGSLKACKVFTAPDNYPLGGGTDCEGDLVCDKTFCATKVDKKTGEPCANPGDICEDSAYCAQGGAVASCTAKKAKGEACNNDTSPCSSTLRCTSTCADRFGSGETCTSNSDCAPSAPYCDPSVKKCSAGFTPATGVPGCADFGG